jgi:hypothetical protein
MCGEERNHGVRLAHFDPKPAETFLMSLVFYPFLLVSSAGREDQVSRPHSCTEPVRVHDIPGFGYDRYVSWPITSSSPLLTGFLS